MATVEVSSFSEFVSAIAVSGDTVECPENAVWDMNDLYPDGYTGNLTFNCSRVNGNGTTIKNLHMFGKIKGASTYNVVLSALHIVSFIASGMPDYGGFFEGRFAFISCKISGILSAAYRSFDRCPNNLGTYSFYKCSLNIESSNTNFGLLETYGGDFLYSRIEIRAANSTRAPISAQKMYFCECIFYVPNATAIYSYYFAGCTLRGDLTGVTRADDWAGQWNQDISVYDSACLPSFTPKYPQYFIAVTEDQMKDPAYLRALNFPIGVN